MFKRNFRSSSRPPSSSSSAESTLIDLLSLGIYVSQGIGYFNLSTSKPENGRGGRRFVFKWFSIPVYFGLGLIITQIFITGSWAYLEMEMTTLLQLKGTTARMSLAATTALTTVHIMIHRLIPLFYPHKILQMWRDFIEKIDQISSSPGGNFVISTERWAKHSGIFRRIKTSVRRTILGSLILILAFVSQLLGSFVITKSESYPDVSWLLILLLIGGNALGAVNVFASLWLTFPAQILNACLEMVASELGEIETLELGELDLNEIFNVRSIKVKSTRVSDKLRTVVDEKRLDFCIINYYRIVDLVKNYEKGVSIRICMEIAYNSIKILSFLFIFITWMAVGEVLAALSRALPLILGFKVMYHLGTEVGRLEVNQKLIFQKVCRIPLHLLSDEMRLKLVSLMHEMSVDKLAVESGSFFIINRKLLISISSAVLTFLVVMVQFQGAEGNRRS